MNTSLLTVLHSSLLAMNTNTNEAKSNAQLTPAEKEERKKLKAQLKFQRRVQTIERRIRHSISRKDPIVEQSARDELEALMLKSADGYQSQQQYQSPNPLDDPNRQIAIDELVIIWRKLLSAIDGKDQKQIRKDRIEQTEKAVHLLQNMTKGTQSKSMLQDTTALRGYTRQKFHGRASLIIESLGKLSPKSLEMATISIYNQLDTKQQKQEFMQQKDIMTKCWEKLGNVQRVCSLGCGPGNDVVGLAIFLKRYFKHRKYAIKEIAMLDYAIADWKSAVLDDLIPILQPDYCKKITCEFSDITDSTTITNSNIVEQSFGESDIFLTSYLMTETRNQWDEFIIKMVDRAKVGALFYFAEPVPWQLHRLIRMSAPPDLNFDDTMSPLHRLRFVWIDCSMHYPDMQTLDGRSGGPAVLLAMKV